MFFHIDKQSQENYPCHWQLGNFSISTDTGWQLAQAGDRVVLYKGYVDNGPIESFLEQIVQQVTPQLTGNFCLLTLDQGKVCIKTDLYRSFPIYIGNHNVNNLIPQDRIAWCDSLVTVDNDFCVTENKFDVIGNTEIKISAIDDIDARLTKKVQQFGQQVSQPIKIFLSGGVDTLLVYSYVKKLQIPHELVWNQHCDLDWFTLQNHSEMQKHWGYTQIHYWKDSTVLASGAPGDEFTLRSPTTANWYLLHHGTNILDLLLDYPSCLHREYFTRYTDALRQQIQSYKPADSDADLVWKLCNNVSNDWQHWHIGKTLTWTPLRDLELFKMFLSLPRELATQQIMDSAVSKTLIERNSPGLTAVLSDQKNHGNFMKNLTKILQ